MGVVPTQQNVPAANLADGQNTSLPSAAVAQNAALNASDLVLVAAVAPEQQNEFVGMTAEQLMQLDLYFVPGGETPATPQSGNPGESEPGDGDFVCPEGQQDSSIFASLEPAAEEAGALVAAADPNSAPVEGIEQGQEIPAASGACIGDLTELSLLELMSVRVAAEPTPILPQLQPVDLDTLFDRSDEAENNNRENLNEDSGEDTFFPLVEDPVQTLPPFNVSPIAGSDKYAIGEDGTLTVTGSGVLKNDTDGNGDLLSVSLLSGPSNGTLTLNSNGRFVYTPNADYNGTDSFTYLVSDGNGGLDSATVMLTVAAVNDAPVLTTPGTIAVTEDTATKISGISVADVDVGTGTITVTLGVPSGGLSAASGGGVTVTGSASTLTLTGTLADINTFLGGGNVTYTPVLNNDVDVNLTVKVNDTGNTGAGGAKADSEVVTLDLQPVNDAPVAGDDSFTTKEDTFLSGTVAANDSDVDGGALVYSLVGGPIAGLTFNPDGTFSYAPPLNSNGVVTFDYQVDDGKGGTDTATVTINVTPVNDAPVAGDDTFITNEDTPFADTVAANDSDVDGDTLTYNLVGGPVAGLTFNNDGTFSYAPPLNSNGPVNFTYQVADGKGGTDTATVTINVTAVNDAPVAGDDSFTINEDTALNSKVSTNDSDVDGDTLTYSLVAAPIAGLTFNPDGTFSYAPPLNSNGVVTFDYQVDDGKGGTDTATVTINVTPVNDAPVAGDDTFITNEDTPFADTVAANDSDVDGDTLTYNLVGGPVAGLTFNPDGTFSYAPPLNSNGPVNFTYQVADGKGGTDTATVTINVTAVNDAPVAGDDSFTINEDTALNSKVSTNNSDVDGDTLTYSLVAAPIAGLTFNPDGTFSYAPPLNSNGVVTFDYQVDDGKGGTDTATVTINVTPVNDAPVAGDDTFITNEDTPFADTVAANDSDVDGDTLTYTLVGGPVAGLTFNNDGTFSYAPPLNSNGPVNFTYQVVDGKGGSDTATVTINVTPVNDAPVAGDDSFTTNEDTALNSKVSTNDSDVDGDTLTYSLVAAPIAGLTFNPDGTFSYAPPPDFNGSVTFDYKVDDGNGGTDTATAKITVNPVNDAPVAGDDSFTIDEDTTLSDKVSANDSDVDGDTLSYSLVGAPITGLTFNPDGTFSYAPPLNSNGAVNFTYLVSDGKGGSDTATVTINVTPVNDAPVAGDDSFNTPEDTTLNSKVSTNDSDVDGDTLTYSLVAAPIAGLTFNPDGTFSYAPAPDFNGSVTFDYEVADGKGGTDTATVTINVTAVNDVPVVIDESFVMDEDTALSDTVAANDSDIDGDTLTYTLVGGPVAGLTLNLDGSFSYTPALNFNGPVMFNYQVSDGKGGTDTGTATITVDAVNDAPVATAVGNIAVTEDSPSDITGISFTDVDAGTNDVTVTLSVSAGALTALPGPFVSVTGSGTDSITLTGTISAINSFIATGSVKFTTPLNSNASETLTVVVDDGGNTGSGGAKTDSKTVTLDVTPVNDAPTLITLDTSDVDEETPGDFIGNITVSDPDALELAQLYHRRRPI